MNRTPLCQRDKIFGSDVAQAVYQLVERDSTRLPLALTREQVVAELVIIAQTDDGGAFQELPRFAQKSMTESIHNVIANSSYSRLVTSITRKSTKIRLSRLPFSSSRVCTTMTRAIASMP
jgi:hypothetical protein